MIYCIRIAVFLALFALHLISAPAVHAGPPEDAQILRALPKTWLPPVLVEVERDDITIKSKEVRPGCWKCTVRYQEVIHFPSIGITLKWQRIQVIHFKTIGWIAGMVSPSRLSETVGDPTVV
jgi:hypothetical protein